MSKQPLFQPLLNAVDVESKEEDNEVKENSFLLSLFRCSMLLTTILSLYLLFSMFVCCLEKKKIKIVFYKEEEIMFDGRINNNQKCYSFLLTNFV